MSVPHRSEAGIPRGHKVGDTAQWNRRGRVAATGIHRTGTYGNQGSGRSYGWQVPQDVTICPMAWQLALV